MGEKIKEQFENSVRTVFLENGWETKETETAMAWIKEALGIDRTSVCSGVNCYKRISE